MPWDLTVRKPGGFSEPVVIVVGSDYFDMFETQGWTPEPSAETSHASRTYMTVDPPPGDTLILGFDAYIQPSRQLGHRGGVGVGEGSRCGHRGVHHLVGALTEVVIRAAVLFLFLWVITRVVGRRPSAS